MKNLVLAAVFAYSGLSMAQGQVGDQAVVNSTFNEATPVMNSSGQVLYYKPVNWTCTTYRTGPNGSYCGYDFKGTEGKLTITPYRTSNRLQPSGYWWQQIYLDAGTYEVQGNFTPGGNNRDGSAGAVVTLNKGGPTATGPQLLSFKSNMPAGVYKSSYRIDTAGMYYITFGVQGTPQLTSSGRVTTTILDDLTMTYTGF